MGQLLEAIMLLCFGLSWPMSVVKNYKAGTAKGMSLPFILLITFGYVAGITAKIITHNFTYVLIVYFFNIAAVSLNIAIYFRNLRLDKRAENSNNNRKSAPARPALAYSK